jgi:hypothetical protein
MTWLATKLAIKKAWAWTKNYWYVPVLLIYTLSMWLVFRRPSTAALEVLTVSSDSYKKQIDVLDKAHKKEVEKKEEITKKYVATIETIESNHKEEMLELNKEKKKRVKELIEENLDDEESLAKQLSEMLGVTYVPRERKE